MAKVHRCFNFRRLSKDSKKVLTVEETQKKAIYQDLYAFVRKGEVDFNKRNARSVPTFKG